MAGTQVDDAATTNRSYDLGVGDADPSKANPVAFPTSDSAPIAFPTSTSDETASQKAPSTTPGITFAQRVPNPERTGTPDPESETKRKRTSSQNFQRLARRISVTTKWQAPYRASLSWVTFGAMRRLGLGLHQRRSQRTARPGPKCLRNLQHRALAIQTKIRLKRRKRRSFEAVHLILPTNNPSVPFRLKSFPIDRPDFG